MRTKSMIAVSVLALASVILVGCRAEKSSSTVVGPNATSSAGTGDVTVTETEAAPVREELEGAQAEFATVKEELTGLVESGEAVDPAVLEGILERIEATEARLDEILERIDAVERTGGG